MKKLLFIIIITAVVFFHSSVFCNISKAVYFASDSVYIYENKERICDNSVIFVASYKSYSKRCNDGLCLIGQQFYPVTIHKAKNGNILTFYEFSSQYEGAWNDGEAKDSWNDKNVRNYLEYLKKNSDHYVSFDPGPSEGGEGCGSPGCFGGRIGDDRSYAININNGDYKQISDEPEKTFGGDENVAPLNEQHLKKYILSASNIIYLSTFIVVLSLIIYFKRKRSKKKIISSNQKH